MRPKMGARKFLLDISRNACGTRNDLSSMMGWIGLIGQIVVKWVNVVIRCHGDRFDRRQIEG